MFPNHRKILLVLGTSAAVWPAAGVVDAAMPNIVYILADDFGYGSANCYGADPDLVRTPSIDRLAEQGIRFTDAHTTSSVCSPTRYSVLTGRYPWRSRMKWGVINTPDPFLIEREHETLSSWLKSRGYRTSLIGKWHLGFRESRMSVTDWMQPLRPGPGEIGFDYYFGVPQNHGDITGVYVEDDRIDGLRSEKLAPYTNPVDPNRHPFYGFDAPQRVFEETSEVLTDKAVDWLDKQSHSPEPFFLFFCPVAVHDPITPSAETSGTSSAGPYGDFIHDLDRSIGRILDKIDSMGASENTLVIFTSDNGGDIDPSPSSPHQVAIRSGLSINGDLRGDKHTIWEGGTRVPFIARLPGKAPAGKVSERTISLVDSFATIAELVDDSAPIAAGSAQDSVSFLDALNDAHTANGGQRTTLVTANVDGVLSIRRGRWKYIEGEYPEGFPRPKRDDPQARRQLYDLSVDQNESNNLVEDYPDVARELQGELDATRGVRLDRDPARVVN